MYRCHVFRCHIAEAVNQVSSEYILLIVVVITPSLYISHTAGRKRLRKSKFGLDISYIYNIMGR